MEENKKNRAPIRLKKTKEDDSWKEDWRSGGNGKKQAKKVKQSFRTKSFRLGSYTAVSCIVVLAIIILLNLSISSLPSNYTKIDISKEQYFSLSQQSEQIAKSVEEELTIYVIAQTGNADETIAELLARYQAVNSNIKVVQKDPVVNPTFTSAYTTETVAENSLILVYGDRSKYVPYSDIYVTSYNVDSDYSYSMETSFDGENQITSAINSVTSAEIPKIYYLTGHGEQELPSYVQETMLQDNLEYEELNLLSTGEIPEDCGAVLEYAPAGDISENEKELLLGYMKAGGKFLYVQDASEDEYPNLAELLAYYGVTVETGIVLENDSRQFYLYQTVLIPKMQSHTITEPLSGYNVLFPYCAGISTADSDDLREGLSVSTLLKTSDDAYVKTNLSSDTYEKEEGDIDGPFAAAVAVTDTHAGESDAQEDSGESRLIVLGTSYMLQSDINSLVSGANEDFFLNALEWLCERENTIAIRAKSLDAGTLTVAAASSNMWKIILIGILPLATVIGGGMYIYRRKKK